MGQWDEKERLAYEFARRAADLDSSDAMVEIVLGRITLYRVALMKRPNTSRARSR